MSYLVKAKTSSLATLKYCYWVNFYLFHTISKWPKESAALAERIKEEVRKYTTRSA
jgi:hypothetical protein